MHDVERRNKRDDGVTEWQRQMEKELEEKERSSLKNLVALMKLAKQANGAHPSELVDIAAVVSATTTMLGKYVPRFHYEKIKWSGIAPTQETDYQGRHDDHLPHFGDR